MKTGKNNCGAFTVWETIVVLVTVALFLLAFPYIIGWRRSQRRSPSISCVNNLRQLGLALRVWSNDHGDKFPMQVSANSGGSLEFIATGDVFRHVQAMSNQLFNPNLLVCPSDKSRKPSFRFATLTNLNLSYFLGLDATELDPQMIFSGDRNISTNSRLMNGILTLPSSNPVGWTEDLHNYAGNIGLADGSTQQTKDYGLTVIINSFTNRPARLAIP